MERSSTQDAPEPFLQYPRPCLRLHAIHDAQDSDSRLGFLLVLSMLLLTEENKAALEAGVLKGIDAGVWRLARQPTA